MDRYRYLRHIGWNSESLWPIVITAPDHIYRAIMTIIITSPYPKPIVLQHNPNMDREGYWPNCHSFIVRPSEAAQTLFLSSPPPPAPCLPTPFQPIPYQSPSSNTLLSIHIRFNSSYARLQIVLGIRSTAVVFESISKSSGAV
jgi:hypothetical protein